jgi:hypothetical protein
LSENVFVMVGVSFRLTTGTKNTNPQRNSATKATAEILLAFLRMDLSKVAFEQKAQSPQRHPGWQTPHEHLDESFWNIFKAEPSPLLMEHGGQIQVHISSRLAAASLHGLAYIPRGPMSGKPAPGAERA